MNYRKSRAAQGAWLGVAAGLLSVVYIVSLVIDTRPTDPGGTYPFAVLLLWVGSPVSFLGCVALGAMIGSAFKIDDDPSDDPAR